MPINPIRAVREVFWFVRGGQYFWTGRYDLALGHLSRIRSEHPFYRIVLAQASYALFQLGKMDEAMECVGQLENTIGDGDEHWRHFADNFRAVIEGDRFSYMRSIAGWDQSATDKFTRRNVRLILLTAEETDKLTLKSGGRAASTGNFPVSSLDGIYRWKLDE